MRLLAALASLALIATPAAAADLALWRLDCGEVEVPDLDFLSDTFVFSGQSRTVAVSCYLVRHGDDYLLWDAGLPLSRLGVGQTSVGGGQARLRRSLVDQLKDLGVAPGQVGILALSHHHADHAGQAASFPGARLVIGAEDLALVRGDGAAFNLDRSFFAPWTRGGGALTAVTGDHDVYGDGRVVLLATPGHTPGHHALLVRLASGPVILSGDLWHFREQEEIDGVPKINTNRADTLASMDRIRKAARALHAKVIIGHDLRDIPNLPPFPKAQR
jgi:glyoxylase-like metal-dependent hydrolase (beta-lactamase superfamily II)